jgi:hypothetical protein
VAISTLSKTSRSIDSDLSIGVRTIVVSLKHVSSSSRDVVKSCKTGSQSWRFGAKPVCCLVVLRALPPGAIGSPGLLVGGKNLNEQAQDGFRGFQEIKQCRDAN